MKIRAELTFPEQLKNEAVICNICKQFEIVLNILEASFSTGTGWAILVFEGKEEELNRVFAYLKSKSIKISDIQK